jgi:hypothetical protein
MMIKYVTRCMMITMVLLWTGTMSAVGTPSVELHANKQVYLAWEPVLLRVTIRNDANQFEFQDVGPQWEADKGFSINVGQMEGKMYPILDQPPFEVSVVPAGSVDTFRDRYYLPKVLQPSETLHRVEMLVLSPGEYRLQTTITDSDDDVLRSNTIVLRVEPVGTNDSICRSTNEDFTKELGATIFLTHYLHGTKGAAEGVWSAEEFLRNATGVIERNQDSVLHQYTVYAYAMYILSYVGSPSFSDAEVARAKDKANWFLQTYPNSWLAPELEVVMFDVYRREDRLADAIAIGTRAIANHPYSLLIRNSGLRGDLLELQASVQDRVPPSVTITGPEVVTNECGTAYTDAGATATDNKDGDITAPITVQNNVNPTVPGTYTVVYTVSDAAGNTATATRTVNVVDTTLPVLTCQAAQVHKPETCGGVVNFAVPTALDQCAGSVAVTCSPASGDVLAAGVHTVNCSATDSANNTGTCSFTVDVKERLQVRFVAPLADDNVDNNIETDADVVNTFKVGSRVIHKVKLFDCTGNDVTEAYASLVTVKLDVTLRTATNTGSEVVNDVPEVSSGVGNAGGLMIPVGGHFQYNLDTTGYAAGTVTDGRFYRSEVTVEWVSAPGLVVGGEDVLLESKP